MIYNTPAPIPILPNTTPIRSPDPQPPRSGSVLAAVISKAAALASKQPEEAKASRVGMCFHIINRHGELSRRGIVVRETPNTYTVYFADPLSGIVGNKRVYAKAATSKWQWFANVEESNAAYFVMN